MQDPAGNNLLLIDGQPVTYEIRRSRRRRTLCIEVHPDLRVIVRAPARCRPEFISAFVAERRRWIGLQRGRLERRARERLPPRYASGASHLYLGASCTLTVSEAARTSVTLDAGELRVAVRGGTGPERVRSALESWYRRRAREVFGAVLAERFAVFHRRGHDECPSLTIRSMRTRWGSLAQRRRMTLNLALVRAPIECIEYVTVHELCHLEHRGHGRAFHALMDQLLPDWRARKRRLEETIGH